MKCKPYSENTVEIGTQLKTVKITSNIFAVYTINMQRSLSFFCGVSDTVNARLIISFSEILQDTVIFSIVFRNPARHCA